MYIKCIYALYTYAYYMYNYIYKYYYTMIVLNATLEMVSSGLIRSPLAHDYYIIQTMNVCDHNNNDSRTSLMRCAAVAVLTLCRSSDDSR